MIVSRHGYRFYTHDFDVPKLAVSIRQKDPLLRETRQWGIHRLAVEGTLTCDITPRSCDHPHRPDDNQEQPGSMRLL